jgi:hypothetical protein
MSTNVNLDSLLKSELLYTVDKIERTSSLSKGEIVDKTKMHFHDFIEVTEGIALWHRLRKAEFQRITAYWSDEKIVNLLKSLLKGRIIPGVILWLNESTGCIFVLDGAHRLSVIRAWFLDDWGDKSNTDLEESEQKASKRIRNLVAKEIGSYQLIKQLAEEYADCIDRNEDPSSVMGEANAELGRLGFTLNTKVNIPIQWVKGDYNAAEESFITINTGGAVLLEEEAHFLVNRRSPICRVISGIIDKGVNKGYWLGEEEKCIKHAKELNEILLKENKLSDNSSAFASLNKRNRYDKNQFLLNTIAAIKYGKISKENTEELLKEKSNEIDNEVIVKDTLEILELLTTRFNELQGKKSQSLGLLPTIYFFDSDGNFKETFFSLFLCWFYRGDMEIINLRRKLFTLYRNEFEQVWINFREYFSIIMSRKGVGPRRIHTADVDILEEIFICVVESSIGNKDLEEVIRQEFIDKDSNAKKKMESK